MMSLAILATCNLNQWAMDFQGNLDRIRESIAQARKRKARYRIGPELEVTGYGCEDHFLELDTFTHAWQCIAELIRAGDSDDMLLDIGAPVMHHDVAYNCRILILNREILLIRPKADLADHGNYREPRWFRSWSLVRPIERFTLPDFVRAVCKLGVGHCAIGHAVIELDDGTTIGCETCEELWTPQSSHIALALAGVHVIGNGSASHHVLRKLHTRIELMCSATRKAGGVYLYANQRGCDGSRLYYDGSALIALNGDVLAIAPQFSVAPDVNILTAAVDLNDVIAFRARFSARGVQAAAAQASSSICRIQPKSAFSLRNPASAIHAQHIRSTSPLPKIPFYTPEEEIARGPACWLWDYLRRSKLNGFFVALSGGADSASTVTIVGSMCHQLVQAAQSPNVDKQVLDDIRQVTGAGNDYVPDDPRELANRILHTAYMPCGQASSSATRGRAKAIAHDIGAYHSVVDITRAVESVVDAFVSAFGITTAPRFRSRGGSAVENIAMQNVQARIRMVTAYVCAQLSLWARGRNGGLLVLGSSNVDESLRGYLTKYDCSAADINPIGGISKTDLRRFLNWAACPESGLGYQSLTDIVESPPTAELEPIENGYTQTDEQDMGMSYSDLTWFGRLRKLAQCGPLSMFRKLLHVWHDVDISEIAEKVKFFFKMYSINRHKLTTLTPSYHAEDYSPEDNRYDLRPFLYNSRWTWQFRKIDEEVDRCKAEKCS